MPKERSVSQQKLLSYTFIIFSLLMIVLALSYWPNADDFCVRTLVESRGLVSYLIHYYHAWSGRVFTLGIFGILIEFFPITNSNLMSALFVLVYLLALYKFVRFWQKYISTELMTGLVISFFLFWFGLRGIIGEVVYWPTGAATYLVPFLLGIWWMNSFDLDLEKSSPGFVKILFSFLISIIVGNSIEVLSPILCAYGFFMLLAAYKRLSKEILLLQIMKIIGIVLGTLFLILAPGNLVRAQSFPQGITFDFLSLLTNLVSVGWVFFSFTKTMLMYSFFSAIMIIILTPELKIEIKKVREMSLIFFLTSVTSFIPMATVDLRFTTRRTTFYFAVILSLCLFFLVISFHQKIKRKLTFLTNTKTQKFIIFIVFATVSTSIGLDIKQAIPLRKKFLSRHEFLNSQIKDSQEVFLLERLGLSSPGSLFYEEITPDEKYWLNSCIAKYYRLNYIRLKENL